MRVLLLVCSLFVAASALAQQSVKIFSITPDHGPISGGTTVTIKGEGFDAGVLIDPPCIDGPSLAIGGSIPQFVSGDATTIVAVTRPYTNGRFDVTMNIGCIAVTLKNAFIYGDAPWERVLLPVLLPKDLPGALGSLWRTELAGFDAGFEGRITGDPEVVCDHPGGGCPGYVSSGPFKPAVATDGHTPGRMIYNGTFNPSRTFYTLRVRDVSRESQGLGTELPAVREDDAFGPQRSIALPNVPLGSLYRAKLRVYRIDIDDAAPLTIDFQDAPFHTVATRTLKLSTEPQTGGFLLYPEYGELDLDTMPELAALPSVNVVVRTPPQGLYYAMVSVTNNDTQQITLVAPR